MKWNRVKRTRLRWRKGGFKIMWSGQNALNRAILDNLPYCMDHIIWYILYGVYCIQNFAFFIRLASVCWAIYVMVTFYIDVKDRKLQELQKLENQTESAGEYIPEYDYYESTDFQLPIRFLQENFQNSRIDIISYIFQTSREQNRFFIRASRTLIETGNSG